MNRLRKPVLFLVAAFALLAANVHADYCTVPGKPAPPPFPDEPPERCQPRQCDKCTGSPCFVSSGIYTNDFVDLMIPTFSYPITVGRTYSSARLVDGPLGVGWTSTLTPRLYHAAYLLTAPNTYQHEIHVVWPSGWVERFSISGGTITPPAGRYDSMVMNGDGTFDMTPQHTREKYHFDSQGALLTMADDYNNVLAYTYDANQRVQTIADQAGSGRSVTIGWVNGRIGTVTQGSRHISFGYGADGSLTSMTDPVGRTTALSYTAGRFGPVLSSIRDHWNRLVTALTFNSAGQLASYTDGDPASGGETYTYQYYPNASPPQTIKSDSYGSRTFVYGSGGVITNDPSQTYDPATGLATVKQGPAGNTFISYNSSGLVTRIQNSLIAWTINYDTVYPSKIASVVPDNPGLWTKWAYDYYQPGDAAPGALKNVWRYRTDGTTRDLYASYTYDSRGRVVTASVVDQSNQFYTFGSNASGPTITINEVPGATTLGYDTYGRLISITDASGHATTYTYDDADRLTSVTLPRPSSASTLNFVTTYTYDHYDASSGLVYAYVTDANSHVTKEGRDVLGNQVQSIDAAGNATTYTYAHGLLDRITDPNGNVHSYTYDSVRRVARVTYPDGAYESYTYTSDGSIGSVTDRRGTVTQYTYDLADRITSRTATVNGVLKVSTSASYNGEMLQAVSQSTPGGADMISYTHDTAKRIVTETQGTRAKLTYTYGFGATRLPASFTAAPASGTGQTATVSYTYDSAFRVSTIHWSPASGDFTISYKPSGQYDTITYPNGQTRTFSYDNQGRVTQVANAHPLTGNIVTFDYGYDHDWVTNTDTILGQRTSVTASYGGQPPGITQYRYDNLYQLTRADFPSNTWESWTYDAIGNRTARVTSGSSLPFIYVQNGSGHNTERLRSAMFSQDYAFDANGNQLGAGSNNQYTWDELNRLTQAFSDSYSYDPLDRRITTPDGNTVTTQWYHGQDMIGSRNAVTGNADYLFLAGIDEPVAKSAGGAVTYFSVDGIGSVVARTDTNGNVLESASYSPWGEGGNGGITAPFGFAGRELTNYGWYCRARTYNPSTGRFTSEEPLGLLGDSNAYRYALNSPALYVDHRGQQAAVVGGGVVVVVGTAIIGLVIYKYMVDHPEIWEPFRRPQPQYYPPATAIPPNEYGPRDRPVQPGRGEPRPGERYDYPKPTTCPMPFPGGPPPPPGGCDYPNGYMWRWAASASNPVDRIARLAFVMYICHQQRGE